LIQEGNTFAVCDVSIKSNQFGGYWIISNRERVSEIEWKLYDKKWEYGTIEGSEATILLDLIITIAKKAAHIDEGRIIVRNDNRLLVRTINNQIWKENEYTISAGVEIVKIKEVLKSSSVQIKI